MRIRPAAPARAKGPHELSEGYGVFEPNPTSRLRALPVAHLSRVSSLETTP